MQIAREAKPSSGKRSSTTGKSQEGRSEDANATHANSTFSLAQLTWASLVVSEKIKTKQNKKNTTTQRRVAGSYRKIQATQVSGWVAGSVSGWVAGSVSGWVSAWASAAQLFAKGESCDHGRFAVKKTERLLARGGACQTVGHRSGVGVTDTPPSTCEPSPAISQLQRDSGKTERMCPAPRAPGHRDPAGFLA